MQPLKCDWNTFHIKTNQLWKLTHKSLLHYWCCKLSHPTIGLTSPTDQCGSSSKALLSRKLPVKLDHSIQFPTKFLEFLVKWIQASIGDCIIYLHVAPLCWTVFLYFSVHCWRFAFLYPHNYHYQHGSSKATWVRQKRSLIRQAYANYTKQPQ